MEEASHFDLLEQRLVPQSGDGGTPIVAIERGFTERSNSRSNSRSNTAFFAGQEAAPQPPGQPLKQQQQQEQQRESPHDVAQPPATPSLLEQQAAAKQPLPPPQSIITQEFSDSLAGLGSAVQHVDKRQRTTSDQHQHSPPGISSQHASPSKQLPPQQVSNSMQLSQRHAADAVPW